jgi:hypothetical protein
MRAATSGGVTWHSVNLSTATTSTAATLAKGSKSRRRRTGITIGLAGRV